MEHHADQDMDNSSESSTASVASLDSLLANPNLAWVPPYNSTIPNQHMQLRHRVMVPACSNDRVPILRRQNASLGQPFPRRTSSTEVNVDTSHTSSQQSNTDMLSLSTPPDVIARIARNKRKADALSAATSPSIQPNSIIHTTERQSPKKIRLTVPKHLSGGATTEQEPNTTSVSQEAVSFTVSAWLSNQPDSPGDYADADSSPTSAETFDPVKEELDITNLAPHLPRAAIMASVQAIRNVEELLKAGFLPGSKYPMYERKNKKK
ncbi:hypothetical protein ACHAQH_003413 [Verticillium albo-atrum]